MTFQIPTQSWSNGAFNLCDIYCSFIFFIKLRTSAFHEPSTCLLILQKRLNIWLDQPGTWNLVVGFSLQPIQGLLAHQLIYFLQIIRDSSFCGLVAIPVFGLFAICDCLLNYFAALERFEEGPPFTLQRLCEVRLSPSILLLKLALKI